MLIFQSSQEQMRHHQLQLVVECMHLSAKSSQGKNTNRYNALPFIKFAKVERVQVVKSDFLIFNLHHATIYI